MFDGETCIAEPGFGVDNWYALFLPGATDKSIVLKLQEAIPRILLGPQTRSLLLGQSLDVIGDSQEDFARLYADESPKWAKVGAAVGLPPN